MENRFQRSKWNIVIYQFSPIFMTIISLWCYYLLFKETKAGNSILFFVLMTIIFLFISFSLLYKNPVNIVLKENMIEIGYIFGCKIITWANIYEITLSANNHKTLILHIFYTNTEEYLSKLVSLKNFTRIEELINKIRLVAQKKDINVTEILIKELGISQTRRIIKKIEMEKLSVEYSRNHEVFDNQKSKFDIIVNLLPIAFFIFLFIMFVRISLIFSIIFIGIIFIIAIILYKRGYSFGDALLLGFLLIPAIIFIYGGPVVLFINYFLN